MKSCRKPKNKKLGCQKSCGDKKIIILAYLCQIRLVRKVHQKLNLLVNAYWTHIPLKRVPLPTIIDLYLFCNMAT
jgi:hypothetical protein